MSERGREERVFLLRPDRDADRFGCAEPGERPDDHALLQQLLEKNAAVADLDEEEIALQEFILAAGATSLPIEARCIRGNTGFAASNFVQAVDANLLVVPWEMKSEPEPKLPARIAWVSDVIPCNLWIVR